VYPVAVSNVEVDREARVCLRKFGRHDLSRVRDLWGSVRGSIEPFPTNRGDVHSALLNSVEGDTWSLAVSWDRTTLTVLLLSKQSSVYTFSASVSRSEVKRLDFESMKERVSFMGRKVSLGAGSLLPT
jgi:hypothetical protein